MAGKKGQVVQLQAEINTEEEWQGLLEKEGLTVADIYAGWCGPCVGMIGNLKKIKLEYGGEVLNLAIVKSDEIEDLQRFRNKSEPTWMFIAAGQLSDLMFGANAPRLQKVMVAEIEKETKAMAGTGARTVHPFEELTEEEQIRFEAAEKIRRQIQAEKEAKEAAANAEQLRRTMEHLVVTLPDYTLVLLLPYFFEIEGAWASMLEQLVEMGISTADELQIEFEPDQFAELVFAGTEDVSEECKEALAAGACVLKLLQLKRDEPEEDEESEEPLPMSEPPEDLLFAVYNIIYGTKPPKSGPPKVDPESYAGKYSISHEVPALWTPQTAFAKAQCVLKYFPDLAEKFAEPVEPPPTPRLAIMFDTSKAKEIFEMAREFGDEVLAIGFFSDENPETATRISKTFEDYERRHFHITGDERIIMAVSRVRSDPLLSFSTLQPCYISADIEEGFKDYDAFFPEGAEDFPSAVPSDVTMFSEITEAPDEVSIYDYERAEDVKDEFADEDEDETLSMLFGPAPVDAIAAEAPAEGEAPAPEEPPPPPPEEPIDG